MLSAPFGKPSAFCAASAARTFSSMLFRKASDSCGRRSGNPERSGVPNPTDPAHCLVQVQGVQFTHRATLTQTPGVPVRRWAMSANAVTECRHTSGQGILSCQAAWLLWQRCTAAVTL